jgi:hypothetical protein
VYVHHAGALPQYDPRRRPACDGCPVGRFRHLEVVHAGNMLDDQLALCRGFSRPLHSPIESVLDCTMPNVTHRNHFVPQWYQRRFLPAGATRFFYLDLKPAIVSSGGKKYQRRALLRWGPPRCFCVDDLYTMKLVVKI